MKGVWDNLILYNRLMDRAAFEKMVAEEFPRAIPQKFRRAIKNVGFLVEDEPSPDVRARERLAEDETLLGYYHGVPATARGDFYGVGPTLPDTITLYQKPIEEEARTTDKDVARVVGETIWHEVAHHFGFPEHEVNRRERERERRKD